MAHLQVQANLIPRVQHVGNGVTTEFSFPFPVLASSDLEVSIGTVLVTGTYTVTGVGQTAGGSIVFGSPPAVGAVVTIVRARPYARTTDFADAGQWRADTVNDELDSLAMQTQQLATELGRSLRLSQTAEGSPSLTLPTLVADRALMVNATASGFRLSSSDPDSTVALAAAAAASAAQAQTDAALASDRAASALAAAEAAGVSSIEPVPTITLVEGVHEYELSDVVAAPHLLTLNWGGQVLRPGYHYTIGNTHGAGRTLVLLVAGVNVGGDAVTALGIGAEHRAGDEYWGEIKGSITGAFIQPKAIQGSHIDDATIPTRAYALASVTAAVIGPEAVNATHVADGALPTDVLDLTGVANGTLFVSTDGRLVELSQGAARRFLRSQGAGSLPAWGGVEEPLGVRQLLQAPAVSAVEWAITSDVTAVTLSVIGAVLSGSEHMLVQVGHSGAWVTAGYAGRVSGVFNSGGTGDDVEGVEFVSGFNLAARVASNVLYATNCVLRRVVGTNIWTWSGTSSRSLINHGANGEGAINLGGSALTRVRLMAAGSSTFTAGSAAAVGMY